MSAFATNQVTQFYAVTAVAENKTGFDSATTVGTSLVGSTKDGDIYVKYLGHGGVTRTDLIDPALVKWAKHTSKEAQEHYTQAYEITPNASVVKDNIDSDLILRVDIKNFCGDLSSNHHYFKHAAVRVKSYMVNENGTAMTGTNEATQPALVALMATQLAKSFGREYDPMIKVMVDSTEVLKTTKPEDLTITDSSVIKIVALIPEVDPIMYKGLNDELDFDVYCGSYNDAINEDVWGTVSKIQGLKITNAVSIAALEDFALKERADIYGYTGYPYVNPSKKVLNPTFATTLAARKEDMNTSTGYDVLNIHFAYQGANEQVHLSEKDLVFAGSANVIENLKSALAAKGIKFETISVSSSNTKTTTPAANIASALVDANSDGTLDVTETAEEGE